MISLKKGKVSLGNNNLAMTGAFSFNARQMGFGIKWWPICNVRFWKAAKENNPGHHHLYGADTKAGKKCSKVQTAGRHAELLELW